MEHLSGVALALVSVLTTIGAAIAFVWQKVDKRFSHIERKLEECEARETRSTRLHVLYESALSVVMEELQQIKPESPALKHARTMLTKAVDAIYKREHRISLEEVETATPED